MESEYKSLNKCMGIEDNTYLRELITKVQRISTFIKKIPIVEDQAYYTSRSEEYKKLLKKAKINLEKLLQKIFIFTHGKGVDIKEYYFFNIALIL
jgi:hypothetical protein